ncbi:hypothetical protein GE21DRAFT_6473 [Neurospora crassa]|uniref:Uncharacterized protein n=1 Tax=Neurospora crassa (strain ATCC 24698 / 74-OR23-1A / CBS 708.71 / DSM 1257 / FGSC 987) TaxID=367110 RepID=Q7SAG7_NEUCR|nr:hypothetical protein NCU06983 [Neurospora crassa OR74A]EAA33387.1 hypothetical protein NCU06983 [Neurospora crassa OR74A]KHE81287.1 hypothetical protein GE21DRAFT_6473 [Neurospora crassa]|eukprot:XP_962623.1 hypothetical protein NCU06983 [Neurospora crassa OR74A]
MKNFGVVALSGAALLQVASAACCRSNNCLKAVALADFEGVMDCKSNLIVTVTPSASTYTETVTLVQSAVDTVLFTETTTEIASTETRILTEVITVTSATTETDFLTETVTISYTTTLISLLPEVTSTSTIYKNHPIDIDALKLKARMTQVEEANPLLPTYATADCADWSQYSKACKCIGITASTITASVAVAAVETVTVTASDVATLSTTSTAIISITETVSDTVTETIGVTDLITATTTLTISSAVETATTTSTPVSIVPLVCQPRGLSFRARTSTSFPDGSTRWMNLVGNSVIAWQSFSGVPAPGTATSLSSTWVLDSNGYLELAQPVIGQTSVYAAYVLTSDQGATVSVRSKLKAEVEAGVVAGTMERVKGCVDAGTGQLMLSTSTQTANGGRGNMLSCGNGLYLSRGKDGKDVRSDCVYLMPVAA